jgi:hypothetical protein
VSFVLGVILGLFSGGAIEFVLQRIATRRTVDALLVDLREEYHKDLSRWWEERSKRDALLARAGYFLLGYDPYGRPLADPRSEKEKIVNAIADSGAMGPSGTTGPSRVPS